MIRIVLTILVSILGSVPALAQSSMLDLSKPMTGKSRYGINSDGSPLELGVPARVQTDLDPGQQPRSGAAVVGPCGGTACGSTNSGTGGGSASAGTAGGAGRPKTEYVSGYTRKDGTHVGSYMRAPRRR